MDFGERPKQLVTKKEAEDLGRPHELQFVGLGLQSLRFERLRSGAAMLAKKGRMERPFLALLGANLRAQVLGVDVYAGLGAVDQIPAVMIGVIVDDKVVTRAIPAPAGGEVPVPRSDFKREAAGKP
jgi:hypothetical protein